MQCVYLREGEAAPDIRSFLLGSVGFAMGPVVAVWLAQAKGMEGLWMAALPVLLVAPFVYLGLPEELAETSTSDRAPPAAPREVLRHLKGPLGLIFGISAVMAFVQRTFQTMVPIIVAENGGSETLGAVALTALLSTGIRHCSRRSPFRPA